MNTVKTFLSKALLLAVILLTACSTTEIGRPTTAAPSAVAAPAASPTPGCDITLGGRVVGSSGEPVAGASISVALDFPRSEQTSTGADGSFSLYLPYGCHAVRIDVSAQGYQSLSQAVTWPEISAQPQISFTLQRLAPTASPTMLPSPTATAPPATPTPAPFAGGPLDAEQAERLYKAAQQYASNDPQTAVEKVRALNYTGGAEDPSNACGPLSIAELRDAGLVEKYVNLHAFWLLEPRPGYGLETLYETFPRAQFDYIQVDQSLADIDFSRTPLYPGDFIYTFGGTYEHMFTVTRVDDAGRAYSVTNLERGYLNGQQADTTYLVQEVMLYDPQDPGKGQFYRWTDPQNAVKLGTTGLKGYLLIRRKQPLTDPTFEQMILAAKIDQALQAAGGEWHVLIKEVGQAQPIYSRAVNSALHPASVIKAPIAMLFMKAIEKQAGADLNAYLQANGTEGRTFAQLLHAMLVNSEEEATDTLMRYAIASGLNTQQALKNWGGVEKTTLTPRSSTAAEMTAIFETLYSGSDLTPAARQAILDLLAEYTPNDDTRLGVIRGQVKAFYNKRGTLTEGNLIVAEEAIVTVEVRGKERTYLLGFYGYPGSGADDRGLVKAIEECARLFLAYAQNDVLTS